ncbi:transposase, partial [Lactobacillus delbrueckii subsp. jakobsenii ZN7a-9 = DSM 26046]
NLTAFTGVDSQNLLDVMVSVQFILAIGVAKNFVKSLEIVI